MPDERQYPTDTLGFLRQKGNRMFGWCNACADLNRRDVPYTDPRHVIPFFDLDLDEVYASGEAFNYPQFPLRL